MQPLILELDYSCVSTFLPNLLGAFQRFVNVDHDSYPLVGHPSARILLVIIDQILAQKVTNVLTNNYHCEAKMDVMKLNPN